MSWKFPSKDFFRFLVSWSRKLFVSVILWSTRARPRPRKSFGCNHIDKVMGMVGRGCGTRHRLDFRCDRATYRLCATRGWVGVSLPLHLRGGIFKMWPSGPASLASMNYRNERVCNVLSRRGMWPVLSAHYPLTPIIKTTQKLINLARAKPIKYLLITVFVPWPEMFLRSVEENTKAGLDVRRQPMPEFPSS